MSKAQIVGMPEVLGTFLNNADANALKADAASYIKDKAGVDLSDNEINIVENTDATVHVALPYYAVVGNPPAAIGEDDLDASGGSVAGAILGITAVASVAAVSAAATSALCTVCNAGPDNIPGISDTAVSTAAIGAAVGTATAAVGTAAGAAGAAAATGK